LEDDSRRAKRAVTELDSIRAESSNALDRQQAAAKAQERELIEQLEV
jgi:hypothetical protein